MNKQSKKTQEFKIVPYKPIPYQDGNMVEKKYTEEFTSRCGTKAILTKVDFRDKKKKLHEGFVLYVKWLED